MKIAIGSDHIAIEMRELVSQHLISKGIEVIDKGTQSSKRTHYPVFAQRVANAVVTNEADFGILICGTGIGMGIAANKIPGIRAACVSDVHSARMSRSHNNTNILAFGARIIGKGLALEIVDAWLAQDYEGGRHETRLDQIRKIEVGDDITDLA